MSEVGLVPFARVALEVAREVLPSYSHRFSPQRFTQPQLLAILCLMRYEDWTFRGAEIRLGEHGELRRALEVQAVPDHSTLFRFMLRLEERVIGQALAEVVRRLQKKKPGLEQNKDCCGGGRDRFGPWGHQHVFYSPARAAWWCSHAVALLAQMASCHRYAPAPDPGAKGASRTSQ